MIQKYELICSPNIDAIPKSKERVQEFCEALKDLKTHSNYHEIRKDVFREQRPIVFFNESSANIKRAPNKL